MTTANPRLTITLEPSIAAQLRRMSELTGNSQSQMVSEILTQSSEVFERMIRVLEAAEVAKQAAREEVFGYLAEKFEFERNYSEHEVNAILASWHTFGDLFILRRGLIESGWLMRMKDGSRYWRKPEKKGEAE